MSLYTSAMHSTKCEEPAVPDLIVAYNGSSLFLVYPNTVLGTDWLDMNGNPGAPKWNAGIEVERRYIDGLLHGAAKDGLIIGGEK